MAALGYRVALNSGNGQLIRDYPIEFLEGLIKSARNGVLGHIWTQLKSKFNICAHRQQLLVHRLDDADNLPCWGCFSHARPGWQDSSK